MDVKIIVGEKEYIIGKEYEFSDMLQEDKGFEVKWRKGVLSGYCPHPNSANSFVCGNQYYVHCREKVEELDYEILSIIGKDRIIISKANYTFPEWFQILVNITDTFEIYSVKNLYDGEVFTIGDKVKSKRLTDDDSSNVTKIYIDSNRDAKPVGGLIIQTGGYYQAKINEITKVKTPLFTTEDGVEIFVGDDFFVIETQFDKYRLHKTIGGHFTKERSTRLRFHSKEKAEEYVLLNKPCLSIMEVAPIFGQMHLDNSPDVLTRNLAKLKSLVQAKL